MGEVDASAEDSEGGRGGGTGVMRLVIWVGFVWEPYVNFEGMGEV